MKNLFIGIDFSKKKFDVSLLEKKDLKQVGYRCFENSTQGCSELVKWIKSQTKIPAAEWLFCEEHTGLYCALVAEFLVKEKFFLWLENPLQIKQSSGIKRAKNDKVDSYAIAMYACRFEDKAKCHQLSETTIKSLELLFSQRERLMRSKHSLLVSSQEIKTVLKENATAQFVYEQSQKEIEHLNESIKEVEKKMLEEIESNQAVKENYELVTSIKGVALINTVVILVHTKNFSCFETSRQFACYAGVAPFGRDSGTSIKTAPHVSQLANKQIKRLLTSAAQSAIRFDPVLKAYYQRKVAEGKKEWLVVNNVKNKLIHRIFAVVEKREPFRVFIKHLNKLEMTYLCGVHGKWQF